MFAFGEYNIRELPNIFISLFDPNLSQQSKTTQKLAIRPITKHPFSKHKNNSLEMFKINPTRYYAYSVVLGNPQHLKRRCVVLNSDETIFCSHKTWFWSDQKNMQPNWLSEWILLGTVVHILHFPGLTLIKSQWIVVVVVY